MFVNINTRLATVLILVLLIITFGCNSESFQKTFNPEDYKKAQDEKTKEKIQLVLEQFERITRDLAIDMKQISILIPRSNDSTSENLRVQKGFAVMKSWYDKLDKIDISETPPDFQRAFKKFISVLHYGMIQTGSPNGAGRNELEDTIQELEDTSAKYGYVYSVKDFMKMALSN